MFIGRIATERGNVVRPQNAAIVVVLLDSRRHHAGHADTVAAHGQDLVAPVFALHRCLHRFRVLGAELEDVAHFDTALNQQGTFSIRARVADHHVADIGHFRGGDVAIPVDAEVVFVVDIGPGAEVAHGGNAAVNHDRYRHVHRAQRAGTGVNHGADLLFGGEGQRAGDLRQLLGFNFIQFVIAAHQQGNQRIFTAFGGFHQQGFDRFSIGRLCCSTSWAMVLAFGVSTVVIS